MKLQGKPVLNIGINKEGSDYIVSDIHGMYDKLFDKLSEVNFNFSKDRLFSVGDFVDRGEDSLKCFELLKEDWFYAVRGNHEQAAIDYSRGQMTAFEYRQWGGQWFIDLEPSEQASIALALDKLPWAIQLKTANGIIGIVHSQPTKIDGKYNWKKFVKAIKYNDIWQRFYTHREQCLWQRLIVSDKSELQGNIPGVLAVVGGHTTIPEPLKQYNFYCLDTGACYNTDADGNYGKFTLLKADTLEFI